jgi:hypothetical protein
LNNQPSVAAEQLRPSQRGRGGHAHNNLAALLREQAADVRPVLLELIAPDLGALVLRILAEGER